MGNRWIWIASRDSYLEEDGNDRAALEPTGGKGSGGWWTCHKDTRPGDLILLYRKAPKSDIAYLLEATSQPWALGERSTDGVITEKRFERLVDAAVSSGAVDAADVAGYRTARADVFPGRNVARKRKWNPARIEAVRADHEERGAALVERERTEGYDSAVQHEFDIWEAEDNDLNVVEELLGKEDWLAWTLGEIREAVFSSAGWPTDTLVGDENYWVGKPVCEWVSRCEFPSPFPLDEMVADEWLADHWNALRASFNGSTFIFDDDVWQYVTGLLVERGNTCLEGFA